MADINKDIELLKTILTGSGEYNQWNYIYPRTTENVLRVLDTVDVKDMDVYAVLSSSDIPFSLIDKRVKKVDTFDINLLTLRYYYLRKWMLENGILDGKELSYDDIHDIINAKREYINEDEEQSVCFWNQYIDKLEKKFYLYNAILFACVGKRIPRSYDNNLEYLVEYLKNVPLVFENIDIGNPSIELKKRKYDLVYLSNIMDLNDDRQVQVIRDKLDSILKPGGQVICTNLVNHPYFDFFNSQKKIFAEKFVYDELFRERIGSADDTYYRYIKK